MIVRLIIFALLIISTNISYTSADSILDYDGPYDYELFIPEGLNKKAKVPLYFMAHGCTQDAKKFLEITRIKEVAQREGFIVLAPTQSSRFNPNRCWNWQLHRNQQRGKGELKAMADLIDNAVEKLNVNPKRVYALGHAAGGIMVSGLASAYPEKIAGVVVHSALPYGALKIEGAENGLRLSGVEVMSTMFRLKTVLFTSKPWEVPEYEYHNPKKFKGPVMIIHGLKDKVHDIAHYPRIIKSFFGKKGPIKHEVYQSDAAGKTTVEVFENKGGGASLGIVNSELGNTWSGGKEGVEGYISSGYMRWFDDFGNEDTFNATEAAVRFFNESYKGNTISNNNCTLNLESLLGL